MEEGNRELTEACDAVKERFLTVKEVAQLTRSSLLTIRRRIKDGSIRMFQPGGKRHQIRIPLSSIEEWLMMQSSAVGLIGQGSSVESIQPKPVKTPGWKKKMKRIQ